MIKKVEVCIEVDQKRERVWGWKSEAFAFKVVSKTAKEFIQVDTILTAIRTPIPVPPQRANVEG